MITFRSGKGGGGEGAAGAAKLTSQLVNVPAVSFGFSSLPTLVALHP